MPQPWSLLSAIFPWWFVADLMYSDAILRRVLRNNIVINTILWSGWTWNQKSRRLGWSRNRRRAAKRLLKYARVRKNFFPNNCEPYYILGTTLAQVRIASALPISRSYLMVDAQLTLCNELAPNRQFGYWLIVWLNGVAELFTVSLQLPLLLLHWFELKQSSKGPCVETATGASQSWSPVGASP